MEQRLQHFRAWSLCDDCGFEGLIAYDLREGEDYDDDAALAVMVDATCPACERETSVLVALEHFEEMQAFARRRPQAQEEPSGD